MAQAEFTFDEMVYNTAVQGKSLYHNDVLVTIEYVKLQKETRQILIVCTNGDKFLTSQDAPKLWEVNTIKPFVAPNKSKLK